MEYMQSNRNSMYRHLVAVLAARSRAASVLELALLVELLGCQKRRVRRLHHARLHEVLGEV